MSFDSNKYKVKVRKTTGLSPEDLFSGTYSAYLGISMNNPLFRHPSFQLPIDWMRTHFSKNYLLVGDFLNRWNELIFHEQTSENAEKKALTDGELFIERLHKSFDFQTNYPHILRWKPLVEHPLFEPNLKRIEQAYTSNSEFKLSIDNSAKQFIETQVLRDLHPIVDRKKAIFYSTKYLFEELAVFSLLAEEGINVQIYPGTQLPVLSQLSQITPIDIPLSLLKSTFIEIRVKKM